MPVAKILGIDKNVGEGGDGGLVFGVGFEYFGGGLDFLVIPGEGLFDEFDDVFGGGVDKL